MFLPVVKLGGAQSGLFEPISGWSAFCVALSPIWPHGAWGVLLAIGLFWLSSPCKGDEDRQTNRTQALGTR